MALDGGGSEVLGFVAYEGRLLVWCSGGEGMAALAIRSLQNARRGLDRAIPTLEEDLGQGHSR